MLVSRRMLRRELLLCLAAVGVLGAALRCARPSAGRATSAAAPVTSAAAVPPAPAPSGAPNLYGAVIRTPTSPSDQLKASTQDAVEALRRMTGAAFSTTESEGDSGIALVRAGGPGALPGETAELAGKGLEAFS